MRNVLVFSFKNWSALRNLVVMCVYLAQQCTGSCQNFVIFVLQFSGISGLICLESENESDNDSGTGTRKQNAMPLATSEVEIISEFSSRSTECTFSLGNLALSLIF